jgi:hypothetical protein
MRKLCLLFLLLASSASAQWLNHPTPGAPRTRDGKVDLAARAPRASDGKPDLSGVWHVEPTPIEEWKRLLGPEGVNGAAATSPVGMELTTISKYAFSVLIDFKPEDAPMRPEAAKIFIERARALGRDLPSTNCLPIGIPLTYLVSEVNKVVQTPGLTVILYEADGTHRQIYTDGRKPPKEPEPLWLGYSTGRWEGDTLVVDTVGFNDKSWLDAFGHPHSDALHLIERYRRRDFGHLDVEITIDDPKMYTKPFSFKVTQGLVPDSDILESFCNENEKDRPRMGLK